ncbi:hypothetical protein L3Q82_008406, partial [Scortum barcoo]
WSPVAPPPHSCLRSAPIRSRRVTFSQDLWPCEEDKDPGGPLLSETRRVLTPPSGQRSRIRPLLLLGVSELSVVLGRLLQLMEQHWTGPGSLLRHQQFLSGAYDLLSELLQPAGGAQDEGRACGPTCESVQLLLLRRKLERSELQLVSDTNSLSDSGGGL